MVTALALGGLTPGSLGRDKGNTRLHDIRTLDGIRPFGRLRVGPALRQGKDTVDKRLRRLYVSTVANEAVAVLPPTAAQHTAPTHPT